MNKTQKDYLFSRVDGVLNKKIREIEKKYTEPSIRLTNKQKYDVIYSKNPPPFKNRIINENISYLYFLDSFDYSQLEKESIKDEKSINKKITPLIEKAKLIKDMIILEDTKDALKLLTSWNN